MTTDTAMKKRTEPSNAQTELHFDCRNWRMPRSFKDGVTWSADDATIGRTGPYRVREMGFTADTDMLVFLSGGYTCVRAINSDKLQHYQVEKDDLMWLPMGTQYYSISQNAKSAIYVNMDAGIRERFLHLMPNVSNLDQPATPIRNIEGQEMFSALLSDFLDTGGIGGRLRADALINLICVEVYTHFAPGTPRAERGALPAAALTRVKSYIEENLETDVRLDMLADVAELSEFHFSRMFRTAMGVSPHQYVIKRRLERARALLSDTDESIAQIAYQVGFSSQSHLTATFKKATGITPGKFRRIS